MIKINNISKSFSDNKGNIIPVLSDFSLNICEETFYTIVGPNGCGKSTLLNIIAGVIPKDSGEIVTNDRQALRIGYVWQDYRSSLLPWYNVIDNITLPLKIKGISKKERNMAAMKLIDHYQYISKNKLDINLHKKVYELSGGQQQLVNLLRNMIIEPDILLLDEPFSALDQQRRWSMAFLFQELWLNLKIPVLFVSHDVDEATLLADEIIVMNKQGKIEKLISNDLPHPRSMKMLSAETHIKCRNEIIDFILK